MSADDKRREFLIQALAAGMFMTGLVPAARAQIFGRRPGPLPAGRSIYDLTGLVLINGQAATLETRIAAGDRVETRADSQAIFVVGADAFLLRENSSMQLAGSGALVNTLRVATGALLSVFGRATRKSLFMPTSTIGIRGTGLYVEAAQDQSYVCTCYGEVEIAASDEPSVTETVRTRHHDAPRYVYRRGTERRIVPAPFINHSDVELMLIEALVGRTTPFPLFDEDYGGARRY